MIPRICCPIMSFCIEYFQVDCVKKLQQTATSLLDYLIWEQRRCSQFFAWKDTTSKDCRLKGLSPNNRVLHVFRVGFCCWLGFHWYFSTLFLAQILGDRKCKRSNIKDRFLCYDTDLWKILISYSSWVDTKKGRHEHRIWISTQGHYHT